MGIVFLLFRVGLESELRKLVENLRDATLVWLADIAASGALGFVFAHHLLGLALVPSLFVAVAMTATSVGVSVAVWREEGALDSRRGQLLLDVAELDDVSDVVLMALLLAVAGVLLGAWAVPQQLFSAMVLVSLLTCLVGPVAIRSGLRRGV